MQPYAGPANSADGVIDGSRLLCAVEVAEAGSTAMSVANMGRSGADMGRGFLSTGRHGQCSRGKAVNEVARPTVNGFPLSDKSKAVPTKVSPLESSDTSISRK